MPISPPFLRTALSFACPRGGAAWPAQAQYRANADRGLTQVGYSDLLGGQTDWGG